MQNVDNQPLKETGGGGPSESSRSDHRWIEAVTGRGQMVSSAILRRLEGSEVTTGHVGPRKGILVVDHVPVRNRRVVMCREVGGDGRAIALRVRENVNYMVGMEIEGAYEEAGDVWVKEGKGPRRRGVW